jgi:hypothetical protein
LQPASAPAHVGSAASSAASFNLPALPIPPLATDASAAGSQFLLAPDFADRLLSMGEDADGLLFAGIPGLGASPAVAVDSHSHLHGVPTTMAGGADPLGFLGPL